MKAIICVDEALGISFGNKRLSRDRIQQKDMLSYINKTIAMNEYSAKLFENANIIVKQPSEDDAIYFFEDDSINNYEEVIDELIIYCWNRLYPANHFLKIDFNNYELIDQISFQGYSHDEISRNIYIRKG